MPVNSKRWWSPLRPSAIRTILPTIAGSVDRDQLLRAGGNTLADALTNVPGVTSSGFAAGAGRPVIRGMDANRVRMLEDGIGSFDVSDVGPDHGVPIDPFSAERVEVFVARRRCAMAARRLAAWSTRSATVSRCTCPEGTLGGEFVSNFGSGADSRDFAGQFNARPGAFAFHADAYDRHSDDYDTPEGALANSWLRAGGGSVGGAWIDGDDRLGLGVSRQESRYGIPGEESFIDMEQTKLSLRSAWALDAGPWKKLTVDGGWADYQHSEIEDDVAASTFKDREWDARAEAVAGAAGPFSQSALGMQLQRRDFLGIGRRPGLSGSHPHGEPRAVRLCGKSAGRAAAPAVRRARGGRRYRWHTGVRHTDLAWLHAHQRLGRPGVRCSSELASGSCAVLRCTRTCADRAVRARTPRWSADLRDRRSGIAPGARQFCGDDAALARRAGARGWVHLGHGFQQLHLRRIDRSQLRR